jgi:hypothetical protein
MKAHCVWLPRGTCRGPRPVDEALGPQAATPIGAHMMTPSRPYAITASTWATARAEEAGLDVERVITSFVLRPQIDQEIPPDCGDCGGAPSALGAADTNCSSRKVITYR